MGPGRGRTIAAASWTDLRSRLLSGIVLAVFVVLLTLIGGPLFRLLCCATSIVVFEEWSRMTRAKAAGPIFKFLRRALFFGLFAFLIGEDEVALLLIVSAGAFIAFVDRGERKADWALGGLIYAAIAGLGPGLLRGADASGLAALGLVICVVWPTDIFAYFTGRTFGGPKILPSVSPKKTVSGCVGGLVAGVAFGTFFHMAITGLFDPVILVLTAVLSILGQAGDLFESWVKRRFGVKDSGRIIPGHGGLMDRIDALIVATGAAWVFGVLIHGFDSPAHAIFEL